MGIGMTRVQHVKIPVSDLGRSAGWYATLLDLVPFRGFVEHGALRGAALRSPEAGVVFALRERQFCASQPNLAGFDLVALRMASREALAELAAKCDRLGIEHSPVQDRGPAKRSWMFLTRTARCCAFWGVSKRHAPRRQIVDLVYPLIG
jgi:hypothetical protein